MEHDFKHLLSPFRIKGVELRNRAVMLPHLTLYASEDRRPTERHRRYYAERARGGVGLIVTEGQTVHPTGGMFRCVDASDRAAMLLWRDTVDECHAHGAKIFAQLTHYGNQTFTQFTRLPAWAPSPIPDPTVGEVPRAMDRAAIQTVVAAFAAAAWHAREAGFDGVELKIAHDGLLRQFLSPFSNRRDDEYGGSAENRLRFPLEVLHAVRAAVGDDFPVGARLCLDECIPGGYTLDDATGFAAALAAAGLDYISADMGTWMSGAMASPPMTIPPGYAVAAAAVARRGAGIPVVAFGRIKHPQHAEQILAESSADLIGLARALIADPEFVNKAARGDLDAIRPCIACNQECNGRLQRFLPIGCVHNPAAGHERELGTGTLHPAPAPKRVLVVGGGPAGLKAAEVAARRGHKVTLIERAPALGGQVALASRAPGHAEWGEIATHLVRQIEHLGVEVRLGVEATPESVLAEHPDTVVIATGAAPAPPPFAAHGATPVLTEWQALGDDGPREQRVLLLDLGVKFEGAAVSETLAERGNQVQWVAPTFIVGAEVEPGTLVPLRQRLARHGVVCTPETTVVALGNGAATLLNVLTGAVSQSAPIDALVIAGNKRANDSLLQALKARGVEVYAAGDCVAPRHADMAIYEGELAGRAV